MTDLSEKTLLEDDSMNEELEINTPQQNSDSCFTQNELEIIKSLLKLGPSPSSRDLKKLLNNLHSFSIKQAYNKILALGKLNNREFVHYLGIMLRYKHSGLNLDLFVNMKFSAQDKYLNPLIFIYFNIADLYYSQMNYEQKLKIFFRYIFIFSSHMTVDLSIYNLFSKILEQDFLSLFINKNFFINFPFIKEFIIDFSKKVSDSVVKIGYELPIYRNLVYFCCDNKNLLDWVVKKWSINIEHSIPFLFYHYDCSVLLDPIAYEKFQSVDDPVLILKTDLKNIENCNICDINHSSEAIIKNSLQLKKEMELSIDIFNKSGIIQSPLRIDIIRLFPTVDIKALGSFLCKSKNVEYLIKFAESFNFKDVDILEGLRMFLSSFSLGGESQVIDRVVTVYSNEYVSQNLNTNYYSRCNNNCKNCINGCSCNSSNTGCSCNNNDINNMNFTNNNDVNNFNIKDKILKYKENCKKIAYGCIALNTTMFNPTVEKKVSFEDFLKHLGYNNSDFIDNNSQCLSFDVEDLRNIYNGIQENEIKIPTGWADSFDKFLLFKSQINNSSSSNECNICNNCVISCYKHLFKNTFKSFMFLSPEKFFQISLILNCISEFEYYIDFHKKDILRFLESSKMYFQHFIASNSFVNTIVEVIEKTEKPKTSMLPDLKSMFSKASLSDIKEKPISIISSFSNIISEWMNIKFTDFNICNSNCLLLNQLCESKKYYLKYISNKIILNNLDLINDLSSYNCEIQLRILNQNPEKYLSNVCDSVKLKFLSQEFSKGFITDSYHSIFNKINIFNQESFDAFCMLQAKFDDFYQIIQVYKVLDKDSNEIFSFDEKYSDQLQNSSNFIKFVTSSSSIVNIKFVKTIHKSNCPINDAKYKDFDRIVYLLLKCDRKDRTLIDYASCVVNYLSDSLVLLVKLYEYILPLFFQLSPEFSGILIKILTKRIKIFIESGVMCCEETKDEEIVSKIRALVNILQKYSFISENEIKGLKTPQIEKTDIVEL